jgi:agmatinase
MIKTIVNTKKAEDADVVIVSAPYEKTASSHKGTASGPKKVVECLNTQIEFFDRKFKAEVADFVKTAHLNLNSIEKLSPEKAYQAIKSNAEKLLAKNKFIFLLGGEHSVCIGNFEALSKKYDPKDVTILQIDAHCDLRNNDGDYSDTPSQYAHSAVMRRASEMGFPIVQVGIRTYSREEYNYFSDKKNKITVFEWGQSGKLGKKVPAIADILKSIKTKYLYITIDVDGFDPAHMPGTGTAVQGGLEWWYGVDLIEQAISKKELVGADIVEVSPQEETVLTEYGAAQLMYTMIAHKFQKRFK